MDAAALNLHGFYAGIERLLEVMADGTDRAKPAEPAWRRELLQQMTAETPGVRPAVCCMHIPLLSSPLSMKIRRMVTEGCP